MIGLGLGLALAALAALADDGHDGLLLPGASRIDAGHGHLGVVAGGYVMPFQESGTLLGGQFSLGLTDRVAVIGTAGRLARSPDRSDPQRAGWHLVSLRVQIVQSDAVRLGVLLSEEGLWRRPLRGSLGLGLALEAGGRGTRFDVTAPSLAGVRATLRDGEYGLFPALWTTGAEIGVSFRAGDHHRFRLGLPALLTWSIRGEHASFDLAVTPLLVANGLWAGGGVRF